jgi:hypothetical protein
VSTAVAANLKNGKFSRKLIEGAIRRSGKNWKEQLAAYFGKIDLGIDIKATRSR